MGLLQSTELLRGPLAVRWAATARVQQEASDTGLCSSDPRLKTQSEAHNKSPEQT